VYFPNKDLIFIVINPVLDMIDVNFRAPAEDVDEKCALLSHYAANSGNFLPTFWEKPIGSHFQGSRIKKKLDPRR